MKRILFFAIMLLSVLSLSAQKTIVHCGKLIDGKSDQVQSRMSIIIEGNQITEINSGYTRGGSDDQVIDLKDKTVMPGLMDMHVHIESQSSPSSQVNGYVLNDADVAYDAQMYA